MRKRSCHTGAAVFVCQTVASCHGTGHGRASLSCSRCLVSHTHACVVVRGHAALWTQDSVTRFRCGTICFLFVLFLHPSISRLPKLCHRCDGGRHIRGPDLYLYDSDVELRRWLPGGFFRYTFPDEIIGPPILFQNTDKTVMCLSAVSKRGVHGECAIP
jgi:hypothetical protein